jgi:small subunit ribosomal protein S16
VAVKIKLKRMGKIRAPYYRIIVADARTKRDGRAIEEIGKYHPKVEPSLIEVNSDRAQYWLSVGAQPTDPVRKLLEITGDWQRFKGLPGSEGTLKTAAAGPDKKEAFAAAVAETVKDLKPGDGKADKGRGRKAADGKGGKAAAADDAKEGGKAESGKAQGKAESGKAQGKAESGKAQGKAEGAKQSGGKPARGTAAKADAGQDGAAAAEPAAGQGSEA